MKPGRKLDALVAEKVMGFQVDSFGYCVSQKGKIEEELPYYSTDIAAAWEIIPKLRDRRIHVKLECGGLCDVWTVELFHWGVFKDTFTNDNPRTKSSSQSAPHAVCLAALKAVGFDFKEDSR